MKKKFALLMCAIMLFGAMLVCVPASAEAKTAGGPLAITEICYAPEDERFEFFEVINVSNNEVELKDYYIYRFSGSNGGTYHATMIQQIFGYSEAKNFQLVRVSLADVAGDTNLAKNEIAVIWFASANKDDESKDSRNLSVQDFKNYWAGRGCNMAGANVIKLPVYDASGANPYASNDTTSKDKTVGPNANSGASFLPDMQAGFVISFINKSFADTDDMTYTVGSDGKGYQTADKTQARHEAADCSAWVLTAAKGATDTSEPEQASRDTNTSAHYYDFVDETKFNTAKAELDLTPLQTGCASRTEATYLPAGLMVFERTDATKENLCIYTTTKNMATNKGMEIIFPVFNTKYLPNPGTLYEGQMGQPGEIRVTDAANGVGSLVLNPAIKPVVENLAVINDEEPEDETTKAPETTAADTAAPAEKKGCGSAITASALLVIAPALAAGCVVSTKKRRNRR